MQSDLDICLVHSMILNAVRHLSCSFPHAYGQLGQDEFQIGRSKLFIKKPGELSILLLSTISFLIFPSRFACGSLSLSLARAHYFSPLSLPSNFTLPYLPHTVTFQISLI